MLNNKTLLITGGTGSFGSTVIERYVDKFKEIRVFSRDEKKQDDLRQKYKNKNIYYCVGDVRDYDSIVAATIGVDYVFHAAALKQVPSCEFYPMEALKTNVLGTENVLNASIKNGVSKVICLSTDKAVYPINAMGISKAMMEKVAIAKSRVAPPSTIISITRYGNVMASRGSVIPLFINQIKNGYPITITDPNMTRFMMSLDEAVSLVLFAFQHAKQGEIFIQKSPASNLINLANSIKKLMKCDSHKIQIIGTRHGEKLHETLMSREEVSRAKDLGQYFSIPPDLRDLNYGKFIDLGDCKITSADEYNSSNTCQLGIDDLVDLISTAKIL